MSDTKYAYAVARIRALENGLFSSAQIEQLLSVKSYEGALRFLTEHGWGDADTPLSAEAILTREKTKTWETVRDLLKGDDAILAVLSYGDLYHNLKAAIKDAAAPRAATAMSILTTVRWTACGWRRSWRRRTGRRFRHICGRRRRKPARHFCIRATAALRYHR